MWWFASVATKSVDGQTGVNEIDVRKFLRWKLLLLLHQCTPTLTNFHSFAHSLIHSFIHSLFNKWAHYSSYGRSSSCFPTTTPTSLMRTMHQVIGESCCWNHLSSFPYGVCVKNWSNKLDAFCNSSWARKWFKFMLYYVMWCLARISLNSLIEILKLSIQLACRLCTFARSKYNTHSHTHTHDKDRTVDWSLTRNDHHHFDASGRHSLCAHCLMCRRQKYIIICAPTKDWITWPLCELWPQAKPCW